MRQRHWIGGTGLWWLVACLALGAARVDAEGAPKGLYWESELTGLGDEVRRSQAEAVPGLLRLSNANGSGLLVRTEPDELVAVNAEGKTYQVTKLSVLDGMTNSWGERARAQAKETRRQLKEQLPTLEGEQKTLVEQLLAQMPPEDEAEAKVRVERTSETKTIAGLECVRFLAWRGEKLILSVWSALEHPGGAALRAEWVGVQRRQTTMSPNADPGITEAWAGVEGFPIDIEVEGLRTQVTKIEPRAIPASRFEIPEGYTKK